MRALRDRGTLPWALARSGPACVRCLKRTRSYLDTRGRYLDIDPETCGGEPIIKGTRISCQSVLGRMDGSETLSELMEDYPHVTEEAFEAALIYARSHPPPGRPTAGKPWRKAS
ncbi:MAG: DUF433 domain-containing protein [Boseongicola sp. SB0662_bin_57]|nr:DUF433 domain-containing protein [Boseongicola sp. SB0662_bin_57]